MAKRYRFRFKTMDVYQAAVEHFAWTVRVVGRLPKGPFVIQSQIVGASLSIVGNVGEANGREKQPGEVEQHYRYAQGSTFESASYLDALSALDVITDDEYNTREDHLARAAPAAPKSQRQRAPKSQRPAGPPRRKAAERRRKATAAGRSVDGRTPTMTRTGR